MPKNFKIINGESSVELLKIDENSIDAVVTDPPYGINFMGKKWDYDVPEMELWQQVLRVLKPGGHLLCFAGARTYHRMVCRIEDAGFEIRDCIQWIYGSGFPKSLNLKNEWQGWGTGLKPAYEPICLARKPLSSTVANNVLQYSTGAINIDACRVDTTDITGRNCTPSLGWKNSNKTTGSINQDWKKGRWPANLIHDGSQEVLALFPESKGQQGNTRGTEPSHTGDKNANCYGEYKRVTSVKRGDSGSAARFFYCAKATKADRGVNNHPTVKPTDLMRYLCKLITPRGGLILDPFMGSGSTGKAAMIEKFRFVGIEREKEYCDIALSRIEEVLNV